MILIADDQLDAQSVANMWGIINRHGGGDSYCEVSYLSDINLRRNEHDVAWDICANVVFRMNTVLANAGQGVAIADVNAAKALPEAEIRAISDNFDLHCNACRQHGIPLNGRDCRYAFMIDLSANPSAHTPDTSYGVKVIRELALLMKWNHEADAQERIRCAIRAFYGDPQYLVVFHSKFAFDPSHINDYWHLSPEREEGQIHIKSAKQFSAWRKAPFEHSAVCPVVYTTNRSEHDGAILPKIIKWETA